MRRDTCCRQLPWMPGFVMLYLKIQAPAWSCNCFSGTKSTSHISYQNFNSPLKFGVLKPSCLPEVKYGSTLSPLLGGQMLLTQTGWRQESDSRLGQKRGNWLFFCKGFMNSDRYKFLSLGKRAPQCHPLFPSISMDKLQQEAWHTQLRLEVLRPSPAPCALQVPF